MKGARVWNSIWRNAVTKTARRNYGKGNIKPVTMNDMPVPKGDFKFLYSERQRIHNTVLGIGISMLGTGLFLYNATDIIKFHFSPPATYE